MGPLGLTMYITRRSASATRALMDETIKSTKTGITQDQPRNGPRANRAGPHAGEVAPRDKAIATKMPRAKGFLPDRAWCDASL